MSRSRASRIKGRQLWSKAWCYKSGSRAANPESAESAESEAQVISNIPKPGHIWTHDLQSLGGKICPHWDTGMFQRCTSATQHSRPSYGAIRCNWITCRWFDKHENLWKTYGNLKLWLWTFHIEILPVCVYPCFPFLISFPIFLPAFLFQFSFRIFLHDFRFPFAFPTRIECCSYMMTFAVKPILWAALV
jgi:hypothetical protein